MSTACSGCWAARIKPLLLRRLHLWGCNPLESCQSITGRTRTSCRHQLRWSRLGDGGLDSDLNGTSTVWAIGAENSAWTSWGRFRRRGAAAAAVAF